LIITIVIAGAAAFLGAYYLGFFNAGGTHSSVRITIIMSEQGFNDSKAHGVPWPIMNVTKGQNVTIHVQNDDTFYPHGFVINHYFDAGIKLGPGQAHDIMFVADQTGTFLVYCNIICPVHQSMLNGQLSVNP
jgi:heme/copper-type cytochrome/quinol oxidase subunit 2